MKEKNILSKGTKIGLWILIAMMLFVEIQSNFKHSALASVLMAVAILIVNPIVLNNRSRILQIIAFVIGIVLAALSIMFCVKSI